MGVDSRRGYATIGGGNCKQQLDSVEKDELFPQTPANGIGLVRTCGRAPRITGDLARGELAGQCSGLGDGHRSGKGEAVRV